MTGRTSLVEQKKLQWAREKDEMARLGVNWEPLKSSNNYYRTHIRTYSNDARSSLGEMKDRTSVQFLRAGHYGSTVSLTTESSGSSNLKCFDYNGGSLMNLRDQVDTAQIRHRSPSLPPIFSKEQYLCQLEQQRDFDAERSRYQPQRSQKLEHHRRRFNDHRENQKEHHRYGPPGEEREGETSGYASDSVDVPQTRQRGLINGKVGRTEITEKMWQNPYCTTPESSLPPSRKLSSDRMGELNRPRWGSVWGQDAARGDPPPPSWLSRLGQSSQVLVINHDSASSPDSSTTGSTGSDTNKVSYLRGQNIPVDAVILQEREARRRKALELQNAIKQQLEEKDRQKREEKERQMREERLEDERIRREREKERERFEEEQRTLREKEAAKLKKSQAMREVLEAAERLAMEERKNRRKREKRISEENTNVATFSNTVPKASDKEEQNRSQERNQSASPTTDCPKDKSVGSKSPTNTKETDEHEENWKNENPKEDYRSRLNHVDKSEEVTSLDLNLKPLQVPVSKDVAIVLSGRLEDSEILSRTNLRLVNLVVTPSPCKFAGNAADYLSVGLNAIGRDASPRNPRRSSRDGSCRIVQNRLLTPSKYRTTAGHDFGTQTDVESDLQELRDKLQDHRSAREQGSTTKDRKETTNASRRNIEKSTNVGPGEEIIMKTLPRSKSQPRTTLDSRPRWNANRPCIRYRTQSEKDPHYQRRLRLRRRQVESSDEGSRSPSPDRRKSNNGKNRNANRRKAKFDSYDADLSMDSLNSIVPLRIDKNGRINIEERAEKVLSNDACDDINHAKRLINDNSNVWCGQEILSKLSSLKSV